MSEEQKEKKSKSKKPMKFVLIAGKHSEPIPGNRKKRTKYKKGDIVTSTTDLEERFGEDHFMLISKRQTKMKKKKKAKLLTKVLDKETDMWNVLNSKKKVMNDEPLTEEEADGLIKAHEKMAAQ